MASHSTEPFLRQLLPATQFRSTNTKEARQLKRKRQAVACTSCQIKRANKVGNQSNNLKLADIPKLSALVPFRAMGVREQTLSAITNQERINVGTKLSKTPRKPRKP